MKELINVLIEINDILVLLEKIIDEEYLNLLKEKNIKQLLLITKQKKKLLNKLAYLKEKKICFENKYNIYQPYLKFFHLNSYHNKILKKCIILNQKNLKNKKITKNKFYLNQKFLNLYKYYKKDNIYNVK
ncbi:Flagella synthesis protein FlgN [Buchnera aphidicola (Protaphis terricola)]|uniref:flagellar biosynthesis protein FlgN n=1 Tax=Buchnera aphidicola TaxID=9 RepID=UPI003464D147